MQGKIIFLDVDGTLVNYEGQIPESAVKAVRLAREKGNKVYICTGRSRAEVYPEIWEIGLDGMIGGNGSYIEDNGEVIMHRHLSKEQCRRIVNWLHERKLEFYLECNAGLFGLQSYEDHLASAEAFPELKAGTWGGVGELALFGDLTLGEIDKAYAMDVLLEHLHVPLEDTISFGDAKVDIPMLEHSGIGVAMGNGGLEPL